MIKSFRHRTSAKYIIYLLLTAIAFQITLSSCAETSKLTDKLGITKEKKDDSLLYLMAAFLFANSNKMPKPVLYSISSATDPKSPVNVAIELSGIGFSKSPGVVRFTDQSNTSNVFDVKPDAAGWSDSSREFN